VSGFRKRWLGRFLAIVYGLHVTIQRIVMAPASKPRSSRAKPSRVKVREHRERLRGQGLRPIQIWVPDVSAPAFRSAAHRQSLAVAASSHGRADQAFIDSVSAFDVDGDE
jgi:Protein  of unknown function (DUF3018)